MIGQVGQVSAAMDVVQLQPAAGSKAGGRLPLTTTRGWCRPFGPSQRGGGINFSLFARHARAVDLVLFREGQEEPFAELTLDPALNKTGDVWHVCVRGLPADTVYAYRVQGAYAPRAGHRYDPKALLLDPYARALSGGREWGVARHPRRCRLVFDEYDWENDVPPNVPLSQMIVYELHVRGFTYHPSSKVHHPGTFLGLSERVPHLKQLGVTTVQLMPIFEFDELEHGRRHPITGELLRNYWGYSPLSFFAPKASYAARAGDELREFKDLVKTFHKSGIEVILDVVYNHTGEGNDHGPTLSLRGLDNAVYYMLDKDGRYINLSGCGNTLNCNHPVVRDLILDSLAYIVEEFHVDGFRFDLAATLARGPQGQVLEDAPLLQHIAEHPVLSHVKLLAEPWDVGQSLQGKFPSWGRWLEFNGSFRDDVRRFLRAEPHATAAVAKRVCGSLDVFSEKIQHSYHSLNFVTCHDGFTLLDLVSYNHKHNEANGEGNRDGWHDNISFNCGHEGPTDNPYIEATRLRQVRNFLTMLMVSQGVPFLLMGDELGRTQRGNNNAYCQDNEISWLDWGLVDRNASLLRFTRMLIALRKKHFTLGREQFVNRVTWHGTQVGDPDWTGQKRVLAFQLPGRHGHPDLYVLFNAHWDWHRFALPAVHGRWHWRRLVDTNLTSPEDVVEEKDAIRLHPADSYMAAPRSAVILIS